MTTIITPDGAQSVAARAETEDLWLGESDLERATGWTLKPEGICRQEVCVPVPSGSRGTIVKAGEVNVAGFWRHMGRVVVHDQSREVWVLGESSPERARELVGLRAPDFSLPDLHGVLHSLSDHRGKKVLVATWASW